MTNKFFSVIKKIVVLCAVTAPPAAALLYGSWCYRNGFEYYLWLTRHVAYGIGGFNLGASLMFLNVLVYELYVIVPLTVIRLIVCLIRAVKLQREQKQTEASKAYCPILCDKRHRRK